MGQTQSKHHLNGEEPKIFPIGSGARQGHPLLPPPFNTALAGLARAVRQEK